MSASDNNNMRATEQSINAAGVAAPFRDARALYENRTRAVHYIEAEINRTHAA